MELTDIDLNQLALFRQLRVERFVFKVADTPGLTHAAVSNSLASITATTLRDDMASGKVDLAIGPLAPLKAGFFQRRLFKRRYVCRFRRGHALDRKHFTEDDFTAAEHLAIMSAGTGHGKLDDRIRRAGIKRLVRLTVPHFVSVGPLCQRTDMVATVTERRADRASPPLTRPRHWRP